MVIDKTELDNLLKHEKPDFVQDNMHFYFRYGLQYNSWLEAWYTIRITERAAPYKMVFNPARHDSDNDYSNCEWHQYEMDEEFGIMKAYEGYLVDQELNRMLNDTLS